MNIVETIQRKVVQLPLQAQNEVLEIVEKIEERYQNEIKDSADITNLGEILDEDFDAARKELVQSFSKSIENSARQLEQN